MAENAKQKTRATTRKKNSNIQNSNKQAGKANKKTAARRNKSQKTETSPYQDEIITVVILVVSALLALSSFNLCGVFGKWVNYVLFGLFGLAAYLAPYLLFFGAAFAVSNKGMKSAKIKLLSAAGLYLLFTGILHLICNGYTKDAKIADAFFQGAVEKSGGGVIGGAFSQYFCYFFGEPGTWAVYLGIAAILLMLITEKLLFAGLKKQHKTYKEKRQTQTRETKPVQPVYMDLEEAQPQKRKAKVFTFTREGKDASVLEKKKQQDQREAESAESQNSLDLDSLSIFHGYEKKESPKPDLPVYEQEISRKFGMSAAGEQKEDAPTDEAAISHASPIPEQDMEEMVFPEMVFPEMASPEMILPESVASEPMSLEKEEAPEPEMPETSKEGVAERKQERASEEIFPKIEDTETKTSHTAPSKADEQQAVSEQIGQAMTQKKPEYRFPDTSLLSPPKKNIEGMTDDELRQTAAKLKNTLDSFGVKVEMKNISCGPTVTRYELQPAMGVKVSRITGLTDDIKLSLAASDIRIEAPIPGKSAVGIEVPNKKTTMVLLRDLLESREFKEHPSSLAFAVGKDIGGKTIVSDIAKMPHLLIAGATGSGKSVCINTLIMSILYKASPEDVKLIMVDPKVVELSVYNGIPHLLIPVVTDPKKASGALNWAVAEMMERYKKFADLGVRDIKGFNAKVSVVENEQDERFQKMPQIVIIVDELADLMMVSPGEVEDAICRLAQLARAAGIHLIIATQRPSVNVITGLIKANVPSRVAFAVSSAVDSRTILDGGGAEKLLGNGDMLFFPSGYPKPVRIQGSFISDKEVSAVVEFLTAENGTVEYNEAITEQIAATPSQMPGTENNTANQRDEYFREAGKFIIEKDKASIGMLQRVYKIGFNRAARIMDQLYEAGVVGPEEGTKPRKIIMSLEEFEQYIEESGL